MRKAYTGIFIAISLILTAAAPSFAQQAIKIAIINSAGAFEKSAEGKRVLAQLQDKDTKIKANLRQIQDSLAAMKNRLTTGSLTMSQTAIAQLQADIDKKTTEGKRAEEDANREFTAFRNGLVAKAQQEMFVIVQALRKEKGYDIIFDLTSSGIVDYSPALEITDEVIRRYDASKAAVPATK